MLTCFSIWQYQEGSRFVKAPLIPVNSHLIYIVKPGASVYSIANDLQNLGFLKYRYEWVVLARWMQATSSIKAGEYDIKGGSTPRDILEQFVKGRVLIHNFTIVEGWTFEQLMDALNKNSYLQHRLMGLSQYEISNQLQTAGAKTGLLPGWGPQQGLPYNYEKSNTLEGQFFPATYRFTWGTSDLALLLQAQQLMVNQVAGAWQQRASDLPYHTPYEALTAASLIEKETATLSERPLIAKVIVNRLQKNMLLQIDPTVIYGLGPLYFGKLTHFDVNVFDSPYNTYIHKGLPPNPIAIPSLSAIDAALHPAQGNSLYFVAKGDGSHQFSNDFAQHRLAIQKYLFSTAHNN